MQVIEREVNQERATAIEAKLTVLVLRPITHSCGAHVRFTMEGVEGWKAALVLLTAAGCKRIH